MIGITEETGQAYMAFLLCIFVMLAVVTVWMLHRLGAKEPVMVDAPADSQVTRRTSNPGSSPLRGSVVGAERAVGAARSTTVLLKRKVT